LRQLSAVDSVPAEHDLGIAREDNLSVKMRMNYVKNELRCVTNLSAAGTDCAARLDQRCSAAAKRRRLFHPNRRGAVAD
jgi:hypothetical protein